MPSRSPQPFRCFCDSCVITGGCSPNGTPLGTLMPASQRVAHLRRVQSEATARRDAQLSLQTHEVKDHVSAMFALTLSDEGPDLNPQSSRLWSSRNDLQPSSPSSLIHPSILSAPTTEAILRSICLLQRAPDTGTADLIVDTLPSPDVYDTTCGCGPLLRMAFTSSCFHVDSL